MAFLLSVIAVIVLIVWEQAKIKYYDYKYKTDPAWRDEVQRWNDARFGYKQHKRR